MDDTYSTSERPKIRPILRLLAPDAAAPIFETAADARLGRDPACEICVRDPSCSRFHARIELRAPTTPNRRGPVVLHDLGSCNGTYVNGQRLRGPRALRNHDKVQIGDTRFAFQVLDQLELNAARATVRAALHDPLTGLLNRVAFERDVTAELVRTSRYDWPLALLVLDLDHFKRVNDTYGHAAGDAVLRAVAEAITALKRASDAAGRLGGEEFGLALPQTDGAGAVVFAERLREVIAAMRVPFKGGVLQVTASIGVACAGDYDTFGQVVADADSAMYQAKAGGRNRVAGPTGIR